MLGQSSHNAIRKDFTLATKVRYRIVTLVDFDVLDYLSYLFDMAFIKKCRWKEIYRRPSEANKWDGLPKYYAILLIEEGENE